MLNYLNHAGNDWYNKTQELYDVHEALMGGTRVMRQRRTIYLPKFPMETEDGYAWRLKSSYLTNFYMKGLGVMMGYVFSRPPKILDHRLTQEQLEALFPLGLEHFLRQGLQHILTMGKAISFVDTPVDSPNQPVSFPYMFVIPPHRIVNAAPDTHRGRHSFSLLCYMEDHYEATADYSMRVYTRERQYMADGMTPVRYRVRSNPPDQGDFEGEMGVERIPAAIGYANFACFMDGSAPLADLAYKNIEHWQSASDQRYILSVSRYPILCQTGTEQPVSATGPSLVLHASGAEAKFYFIEPSGSGTNAGERDLERLIQDAAMMSVQLVQRQLSHVSATGRKMDQLESLSPLQAYAVSLERWANESLDNAAMMAGLPREVFGRIEVTKDFGISADEESKVAAAMAARKRGDISLQTFLAILDEVGIFPSNFAVSEEVARVEDEREAARALAEPMDDSGSEDENLDSEDDLQ